MKIHHAIIALLVPTLTSHAQQVLQLHPVQDAIIAVHPGHSTANTNYDWAGHFAGISQPGNQGGANVARGLMSFDLSSIPGDATIFGAFLDLIGRGPSGQGAVSAVGHMGANTATLRRVTTPWNASTVTWNTQPQTSTDHEVLLGQSTYATQNYLNTDVTALVQDMVANASTSFGFQIALVNEQVTRGLVFYSSEAATRDLWPALTVVYGNCDLTTNIAQDEGDAFTLHPSIVLPGTDLLLDGAHGGQVHITIHDAAGRTVRSLQPTQRPARIPTNGLSAGAYVLVAQDAQQHVLYRERFVVE